MFEDSYEIDDFDMLEGLDFLGASGSESESEDADEDMSDDSAEFGEIDDMAYAGDDSGYEDDEIDEAVSTEVELTH